jgi:hypothetical protein
MGLDIPRNSPEPSVAMEVHVARLKRKKSPVIIVVIIVIIMKYSRGNLYFIRCCVHGVLRDGSGRLNSRLNVCCVRK